MNDPIRILFTNGNVTRYVYSSAGEKLRAVHETAVPDINVPVGQTHELTSEELLFKDSIDYLLGGTIVMKNGRIDKFLFDGGYCQAKKTEFDIRILPGEEEYWTLERIDSLHEVYENADNFSVFYYNRDHLGSVREVVDGTDGSIVQTVNYYPFGMQYCDEGIDYSVQPYMYNGKEFDNMYGLNTYDYGARQYNPVTGRWDRMDQLCEKYYPMSPFAYCMNNPVRFIDPDGRKIQILNETERENVLNYINKVSAIQFYCDSKGYLIEGNEVIKDGRSTTYGNRLRKAIESQFYISIHIEDTYIDNGVVHDLSEMGEGATFQEDNRSVGVVISGKKHSVKNSEGKDLEQEPQDILMHELVGHAIPKVAPDPEIDTGNAVDNENKIRKELNQVLRQKDENHKQ